MLSDDMSNTEGDKQHLPPLQPLSKPKSRTHEFSSLVGPTSLIVGTTAAFCSSALGKSTNLSSLSIFYMILLAIQYSIQPRISKKYLSRKVNKRSVGVVEEVMKCTMATVLLCGTSGSKKNIMEACRGWNLSSSLLLAGLPAAIYAFQGILYIYSYQNLDSVTFNGISQTKTLSAALCCFLLLGQRQSPVQMLALVLLALSALIFQGTLCTFWGASSKDAGVGAAKVVGKDSRALRFYLGILPCLGASFLSGLAGALSQKGLQLTGGGGNRNAFLYTIEVSSFSGLCLVLSMVSDRVFQKRAEESTAETDTKQRPPAFFEHWSLSTLYPIFLKAVGGVLTALVHKHAGSVAKGFALICGLVLSGVIQTLVDDERLSVEQVVGILLVNLSSWLHFSNPKIALTGL